MIDELGALHRTTIGHWDGILVIPLGAPDPPAGPGSVCLFIGHIPRTEAFWSPETLLDGILVSNWGRGGPSRLDWRGWHFGLHLAFCYFDAAAVMDGSSTLYFIWCFPPPLGASSYPTAAVPLNRRDVPRDEGPNEAFSVRGGMVGGPYRNGCFSSCQEMDDERQCNGVERCLIPLHDAAQMIIAVT